uniref:Uncharacterized protein n=1 Tax=Anopheles melas TaxID=34690 RepID=A0A182U801_9DIPT
MRFTITSLASIIRREMSVFRCSTGWCLMMLRQFGQIVGLPPPASSLSSPLRAAAAPLPASPPALQYSAHMHTLRLLSVSNTDGRRHCGGGAGRFEREEILRVALLDAGGTFGTSGRVVKLMVLTVLVLAPGPAPSPPGLPSSSPCSHTSLRAAGLTSIRSHQAGQRVAMYETGWNGSSSYG